MSTQALIDTIIENAIAVAAEKSDTADGYAQDAITATMGWSDLGPGPTMFNIRTDLEPPVTIPRDASGVDSALYDATYNRIVGDMTEKFAAFFAEFFPNECDTLGKAQEWMCRVLTEGGSGLRPAIEDQIWQRDRSRILKAAEASGEQVLTTFAARGWPVPPGAAQHQIYLAQQGALNELGASSRDRAIKQMELEIENIRFCVTNALAYRVQGIAAAADYIRLLAQGPEVASRLATAAADAQARLIGAASSYYNSRLRVEELKLQARSQINDINHDRQKTTLDSLVRRVALRAEVTAAIAQSMGTQAGAALNAIHASAGATLNDSL